MPIKAHAAAAHDGTETLPKSGDTKATTPMTAK
jgi:hypothetical protein